MRTRALRPRSFLALVSLALPLFVALPAHGLGARMEPELEGGVASDAPAAADPVALRLDGMRAALAEIEHQRDVVSDLRARSLRVLPSGRFRPDGRYPSSVLCREDAARSAVTATPVAIAFCGLDTVEVQ